MKRRRWRYISTDTGCSLKIVFFFQFTASHPLHELESNLSQCWREGEVAKYWKFLGKNTIFNEHPVIKYLPGQIKWFPNVRMLLSINLSLYCFSFFWNSSIYLSIYLSISFSTHLYITYIIYLSITIFLSFFSLYYLANNP